MSLGEFVLLIVALGFAVCRFGIATKAPDFSVTGLFKTAAHFFVAGIVGCAFGSGQWELLWIAGALTAVEIFAFLTGEEHEES